MWEFISNYPAAAAALIAAAGAVVGGLVSAGASFLFNFYFSETLKRRWVTIAVKKKYASPIIRAANDLAARIENMADNLPRDPARNWLRPLSEADRRKVPFERYFYATTIFVFARFVALIELLKKEQEYLDFTSTAETRSFNAYLDLFYTVLSEPGLAGGTLERTEKDYWIFIHVLSGIGDALILRAPDGALSCMDFPKFCKAFASPSDQGFLQWMTEVERLFVGLESSDADPRWKRIKLLWYCIDRFLEFVDPDHLRTTRDLERSKAAGADLIALARVRGERLGLSLTAD